MKRDQYKIVKAFLLTLFIINTVAIKAQELPKGFKVNMEMNIDEKGDVAVSTVTKYNATYWDYMKASKALEPSIMKNTMKRQFPKYVLTDFEMDNKSEEEDRTSKIKFKILGSLKLSGNGKWIADLDTKSPDITKISDTKFVLVDESTAQTIKINLPESATGAKIEKDAFGKAILTYTAPVSGGMFGTIIKYLGFLVIAGGGFLFYKSMTSKTTVLSHTANQKIDYNKQKHIDDAVVINTVPKENIKPADRQTNHGQY